MSVTSVSPPHERTDVNDASSEGDLGVTPLSTQRTDPPLPPATERLSSPMPRGGWRGWAGPIGVTALAAALRLPGLSTPHALVFDETYYVKDGLSLIRFGYERQTIDNANSVILSSNGDVSSLDIFKNDPGFVVHPPVGKWVIGLGQHFFGATPLGWRIGVCVLGILSVLMVARIVRRLTRSNLLAATAGLLMAIDGMAIVHSRTALLDQTIAFWIIAAFGTLLLDRDRTRKRLANRIADLEPGAFGSGGFGPGMGIRPWRIMTGLFLGLACGTKWNGVFYVVGFLFLTLLWDWGARRMIGVRLPFTATLARDAIPAVLSLIVIAAVVYVATWAGWFLTSGGYGRHWADGTTGVFPFIPDALRSWWHYQSDMYNSSANITSPHAYRANPWGWPIMARPTSFFYASPKLGDNGCAAPQCAQEVIALGNPVIWWAGALALLHQAWRWVAVRDWRSGAVVVGFLAGWLPWLHYQERTVFSFYTIIFLPFTIAALTMSLGTILGRANASPNRRMYGAMFAGAVVLGAIAASFFFFPIWTAQVMPQTQWQLRMWFPTWV